MQVGLPLFSSWNNNNNYPLIINLTKRKLKFGVKYNLTVKKNFIHFFGYGSPPPPNKKYKYYYYYCLHFLAVKLLYTL